MASGGIKLEGALLRGQGGRGFQMAEMVSWSRLNGVKSTALMRRAHDAIIAHGRVVFGKRIADQPLARRILKIMLPVEQACRSAS